MLIVALYYDTFVNGHKDDMGFVDDAVKMVIAIIRAKMITIILVTSGHCYFGDHFVDDNHFSDQGKEGGGEVDSAVFIYWLVHPKIQLIKVL